MHILYTLVRKSSFSKAQGFVKPAPVRLTDNRPNANIQTKVYHADQTIRNDQQWLDVVRSKSQREPEREHTRKRQRKHQRELEREHERKREHERQRQRQHQRKRELERQREPKCERERKRPINIGDHAVTVIGTSLVRGSPLNCVIITSITPIREHQYRVLSSDCGTLSTKIIVASCCSAAETTWNLRHRLRSSENTIT